jgi:hypothetical protein
MDTLGSRLLGDCYQFIDHQVTFGSGWGPKRIRFIALPNVERRCVDLGINRNRAHPHLSRGPGDTTGNFAAIGNQD